MRRFATLAAAAAILVWATGASAQNAQAERTIIANERAVNEAVVKGNLAAFKQHVAEDGWSIDPMMGRAPVSEFVKQFDAMAKETKVSSWDITESKVQWVDANTAIHTYKWTGSGTYQGQPIPSPVWASTVWAKKGNNWMAVFHQETVNMPMPAKR
jgi:ketosteroid isomerase-like protein